MSDSPALIDLLRAKAVLLLRRESEVYHLRQERSRIATWLEVFHRLSRDLHARKPGGLLQDWVLAMVDRLSFQVAASYESDADLERLALISCEAHVPLPAEITLPRPTQDALVAQRSGRYDAAHGHELEPLARGTGLELFFWHLLRTRTNNVLLLAGFAAGSTKRHALRDYDFSHFVLSGTQVAALIENSALIDELDRERSELSDSNGQLDRSLQSLREAQHKLVQSSQELADVSRRAGMADIATGVLHNVGNVLNSVNVSAELASERLRAMKLGNLARVADLLEDSAAGPNAEAAQKMQQAARYLRELGAHLSDESRQITAELRSLQHHIDHIKSIVGKQQAYARTTVGITEPCCPRDLMEQAVGLAEGALAELAIDVARDYGEVSPVLLDRHKVLQILVNLLTNAVNALAESETVDKRLSLAIAEPAPGKLRMTVRDNGVGLAAEHMPRLFTHGFTTRKNGHGFGLHTSSLAAREMGGALSAHSDGLGEGATFVLELPAKRAGATEVAP